MTSWRSSKTVRADLVGIIPAMPELAGAELPGLPAQVRLLHLADPEGPVAEELGVPLGEAELPGHPRAAERPLALVPAAVHGPVPGERGAVLAGEDGLDARRRPVLEPVGELLDRDEIGVEVGRVHRRRGCPTRGDRRSGSGRGRWTIASARRASLALFAAQVSRGSWRPSIRSGFMSSS